MTLADINTISTFVQDIPALQPGISKKVAQIIISKIDEMPHTQKLLTLHKVLSVLFLMASDETRTKMIDIVKSVEPKPIMVNVNTEHLKEAKQILLKYIENPPEDAILVGKLVSACLIGIKFNAKEGENMIRDFIETLSKISKVRSPDLEVAEPESWRSKFLASTLIADKHAMAIMHWTERLDMKPTELAKAVVAILEKINGTVCIPDVLEFLIGAVNGSDQIKKTIETENITNRTLH